MKKLNTYNSLVILIALLGVFLSSCQRDELIEKDFNLHYLASQTKGDITVDKIKTSFNSVVPNSGNLLSGILHSDVEIQKIVYKTSLNGVGLKASGLVCFPKTSGNYPILSFQNGTNTLHKDAPSENPNNENIQLIESLASSGFIVVIPDYIGFGESSTTPHPYLDAKSSTQSILDLIRAARELSKDEKIVAKPTNDLFIFGYSQGGWATLQLQKAIEKEYSSEFNLIASSCGAGPYSLEYMTNYIINENTYPAPYLLAYMVDSYTKIGSISNPASDFFQAPYADKIPTLFDGLHSANEINAQLTTQIDALLTPEFRSSYLTSVKYSAFRSTINSNSVQPWSVSTPTKLFHGTADTDIPLGVSQRMLANFQVKDPANSSKIELVTIPLADHTTAIPVVAIETLNWFLQLKK
jgi:pimeloyl-ACP methyl ester carboxylesterase